jgi:Matrixin/PEP-CTERM motif
MLDYSEFWDRLNKPRAEEAMPLTRNLQRGLLLVAMVCPAISASAITVTLDYSFDTSNFFGAGNPQGAAAGMKAKTSLQAAANFFSNLITDSLSVIQTPAPFHSQSFDGSATWQWTLTFENPSTGATSTLTDLTIPANQYRIYVGARSLGGIEAGHGGPGGYGFSFDPTGGFTQAELDQLDQTEAEFENEVQHRNRSSGFADWGGAIAFASNNTWQFDYAAPPVAGTNDFYSVALHELGHSLGFGASDEWNNLITPSTPAGPVFTGGASEAQGGGPVLVSPDLAHWKDGTTSKIYGTTTNQETCMDPSLTQGTRKKFTLLDVAGLADVGWSTAAPPVLIGDYNGNGIVDAADYTIWRDTLGSMSDLRANGDNTGQSAGKIDQADYLAWKSNFGHVGGGSGATSIAVPEPASWLLLALGLVVTAAWCGRSQLSPTQSMRRLKSSTINGTISAALYPRLISSQGNGTAKSEPIASTQPRLA